MFPVEIIKIIYEYVDEPSLLFTCKFLFNKNIHKKGTSFDNILSYDYIRINDKFINIIDYINDKFIYLSIDIADRYNYTQILKFKKINYELTNSFISPIIINPELSGTMGVYVCKGYVKIEKIYCASIFNSSPKIFKRYLIL